MMQINVFLLLFGGLYVSASLTDLGLHCYHGYQLRQAYVRASLQEYTFMRCLQMCLQEHDPTRLAFANECKMISFVGDRRHPGLCLHSIYGFAGSNSTVETNSSSVTCTMHTGLFVYRPSINSYDTPFSAAAAGCEALGPGIRLASHAELKEACDKGYGRCTEGWATDGRVYMCLNAPCATLAPGLHLRPDWKTVADVFCIGSGKADIPSRRDFDNQYVFRLN